MGETNPVSAVFALEKAGRTQPEECESRAAPSSIQGGSSSEVPICDNQGADLNPLNTTSQPSFPLSLGMVRLFVSYLFLIIYVFITFRSSGFVWQCFLKLGFLLDPELMVLSYTCVQVHCPSLRHGSRELSQKWIELSHPNGWVSIPWKPKQKPPERNISSESRLITHRESRSLNNV